MGEAKRRGTFEQRKAAALARRQALAEQKVEVDRRLRIPGMIDALVMAAVTGRLRKR